MADGFDVDSFTAALNAMTPESVRSAKESAHAKAKELSSDSDSMVASEIVGRLLAGRSLTGAAHRGTRPPRAARPGGRHTPQ